MSNYSVQPGRRVLWCLRRRASDVRCVLINGALPVEVHILQDSEPVIRERFEDESVALKWAGAYGDRLLENGWREVAADASPSSPA